MFGSVSLVIEQEIFNFSYIFDHAKNSVKIGFPMATAKNRFHILNLHPKKYLFQK